MEETIHIYTDGACSVNPGPAGCGVFFKYKQYFKKISRYIGHGTNNIAELSAIKFALEEVKDKSKRVVIYTDSQYCIGVLTNPNWNPKANKELINQIKENISTFKDIEFKWVKGHSSSEGNKIVDQLAVRAYQLKKDSKEKNY